jgi:hypothetical protein
MSYRRRGHHNITSSLLHNNLHSQSQFRLFPHIPSESCWDKTGQQNIIRLLQILLGYKQNNSALTLHYTPSGRLPSRGLNTSNVCWSLKRNGNISNIFSSTRERDFADTQLPIHPSIPLQQVSLQFHDGRRRRSR